MPERHFLRDARPLPRKVAEWLADQAPGRPLDLQSILVLAPTSGSARRLRAELLDQATERGTGLLPPQITAPMALLEETATEPVASRVDVLLAWTEVLKRTPRGKFPALLEGFTDPQKPTTALRIAQSLREVCSLLAEAGLVPSSPAIRSACPLEEDRWRELGELSTRCRKRLSQAGLADPDQTRITSASLGRAPAGIKHIVVAGLPDLNRVCQLFLENWAEAGGQTTILIDAPDCDDARFDAWGRPDPIAWANIVLPLTTGQIHVLGDPASEAEVAARVLGGGALCLADTALLPFHARALAGVGRRAFDPAGRSLRDFSCGALAELWPNFCASQEISTLRALAEQPAFLHSLSRDAGRDADETLAAIDSLGTAKLFTLLPDALAYYQKRSDTEADVVRATHRLRETFDTSRSLDRLPDFLQHIVSHHGPAEAAVADLLRTLLDSPVAPAPPELLASELAATRLFEHHESDEIEINGWLEAPWLSHEALVISGCTEGILPSSVTAHPFLPDSLRGRLGLATNTDRYARDAYLLHGVLASRRPGMVRLTLSQTGTDGDPTRPSRLLFRCPDDELRDRASALFEPAPTLRTNPARQPLWQLEIPQPKKPRETVRVTAFGEYLDCPFRFYLGRIIGMDTYDPVKAEMDALDFGSALHKVVENFSNDATLRDSKDSAAIEKFVLADLDDHFTARFGKRLSLPVRVQRESLRARLRHFALLQATSRQQGWKITEAELAFKKDDTLEFSGLFLTAQIDRIEVHETTGHRRILDYKTYKSLTNHRPDQTHLGPDDESFAEASVTWNGKTRRWRQLQLPLYRALALFRWPDDPAPPQVGYFLLPEKLEESGIYPFEMDEPLFESALRCAHAVADRIQRGVFWPPRDVAHDSYESLFPAGNLESAVSENSRTFLAGK